MMTADAGGCNIVKVAFAFDNSNVLSLLRQLSKSKEDNPNTNSQCSYDL